MAPYNETRDLIFGILVTLGFHLGSVTLSILLTYFVSLLLVHAFLIGVTQLVYVIPLIIWAVRQQRWGFMKGVIIAAVVTALLNGGCWLIFFNVFQQ